MSKRVMRGMRMDVMSPEEMKSFHDAVEEVGFRRVRGVVIFLTTVEGSNDAKGTVFSNGFSRWEIIQSLMGKATPEDIEALIERLEAFAEVKEHE